MNSSSPLEISPAMVLSGTEASGSSTRLAYQTTSPSPLRSSPRTPFRGFASSGRRWKLWGCLDQWLHDTSSSQEAGPWSSSVVRAPLSWETRIKIIRGVANGLHFLHTLDTPIIHRDIKASNVLLDSEFEAHIADFGLARKIEALNSHVSTQVAGTMGYMPPEYKDGVTVATVKADVYSFGILMVEIATGKRPSWPIKIEDEHNERKEYGLIEWARKRVAEERHLEILDPLMSKEGLRESEVGEFFRIACLCTSERSRDRSSMEEVVELLKQLTS
uniref:Protein kinase domain-containing protein n=1 Tax=Nelumbo nucifera TaxID=4432 RepID=A0A822XR29_NELNU|nr:TPA_asm: hypothetical protein HUJ06_023945 [Nelumbo nucifera]